MPKKAVKKSTLKRYSQVARDLAFKWKPQGKQPSKIVVLLGRDPRTISRQLAKPESLVTFAWEEDDQPLRNNCPSTKHLPARLPIVDAPVPRLTQQLQNNYRTTYRTTTEQLQNNSQKLGLGGQARFSIKESRSFLFNSLLALTRFL